MVSDGIASLATLSDMRVGDHVVVSGRIDRSVPNSPVSVAQNLRVLDRTPTGRLAHRIAAHRCPRGVLWSGRAGRFSDGTESRGGPCQTDDRDAAG
jgi:hypothetical protein